MVEEDPKDGQPENLPLLKEVIGQSNIPLNDPKDSPAASISGLLSCFLDLGPVNLDTLCGATHVCDDTLGQDHPETALHRQVDPLEKHHESAEHFETTLGITEFAGSSKASTAAAFHEPSRTGRPRNLPAG